MQTVQSRRRFLSNLAMGGAGGMGWLGSSWLAGGAQSLAAERPPEVTSVSFDREDVSCEAPKYLAEELLRAEGFTTVRYERYPYEGSPGEWIAQGESRWVWALGGDLIADVDAGRPVTMVAGLHLGCFELFAHEGIHSISDLKGRTVGARSYSASTQILRIAAGLVGLDPDRDIHWAIGPSAKGLFIDGKIDAYFSSAPRPQELRARNIGHSILNTATDPPWSQYFCCMLAGHSAFVRNYPVATKRLLRAILKAVDLCASDPERVARLSVERGVAARYDYELQALRELPANVWRDYDPEDTLRFYAVRLSEVGFIKSTPQRIIAEGTNWRFLNELKRELKT